MIHELAPKMFLEFQSDASREQLEAGGILQADIACSVATAVEEDALQELLRALRVPNHPGEVREFTPVRGSLMRNRGSLMDPSRLLYQGNLLVTSVSDQYDGYTSAYLDFLERHPKDVPDKDKPAMAAADASKIFRQTISDDKAELRLLRAIQTPVSDIICSGCGTLGLEEVKHSFELSQITRSVLAPTVALAGVLAADEKGAPSDEVFVARVASLGVEGAKKETASAALDTRTVIQLRAQHERYALHAFDPHRFRLDEVTDEMLPEGEEKGAGFNLILEYYRRDRIAQELEIARLLAAMLQETVAKGVHDSKWCVVAYCAFWVLRIHTGHIALSAGHYVYSDMVIGKGTESGDRFRSLLKLKSVKLARTGVA